MTVTSALDTVLAEHVAAVNAFDRAAIVATFADDALVNDAHREFRGIEAIGRWVAREMVGDHVTIEVTEVIDHYGDTIVRGRYDGDFDKTNLPGELILTNYFTVRDGKIVRLIVIRNIPAGYRHRPPPAPATSAETARADRRQ
ncbi:MAG: nuclear transport factor 2 family protein [Actinomycetota bacterium]|nr:nuclear transport factor 2 family protein [Actinomycetota bacterium]